MDKETRGVVERATQRARRLLEDDFTEQLEGDFDIHRSGQIAAKGSAHLNARQFHQRERIVAAVEHKRATGMSAADAVNDYFRDAAFTALNRFVALKMLEARDLVQECVTKGEQSAGYREFYGLAHGLPLLQDSAGYRLYIECLFDELSTEVKVLFDRRDPSSVLWPKRATFEQLLEILNAGELASVWGEDETIGWVYQYFNGQDERREMREKSQAPRNSRELAVRNQFFTPRYVVQFLTDNTLGRIWYEMRDTNTALSDRCKYMVRQPGEEFAPRAKKDPRDLRVLDPACGSGHFLLYAFDVLLTIYVEAWGDETSPESLVTSRTLREDYPELESLHMAVPGLILGHNLHGIDIDARCAQIAALSLWMRAQRAFKENGIGRSVRPDIQKTNIVIAEPMPGEPELRREFVATLDPTLTQLVESVFSSMELAGEAGSLLRIEEGIRDAVRGIYGEHGRLFQASDEKRWRRAEGDVLQALRAYAERPTSDRAFQRRMFVDDAARGFGFIDLFSQHYDVVLMNPPFGEFPKRLRQQRREWYPTAWQDILAAFTVRFFDLLTSDGRLGAITSRTGFFLPSLVPWRESFILGNDNPVVLADLGDQVMDSAVVESAAYVLARQALGKNVPFLRLLGLRPAVRECSLGQAVQAHNADQASERVFLVDLDAFRRLPQSPIAYWAPDSALRKLEILPRFVPDVAQARQGLVTGDADRFVRVFWEVCPDKIETSGRVDRAGARWYPYVMRGASQPWYSPLTVVVNWGSDGREVRNFTDDKGELRSRPRAMEFYFRPGFSWTRRAVRFVPYVIPRGCIPSASRYMAFPPEEEALESLAIASSNTVSALLRLYGEWFSRPNFLVDHLKALPWPALGAELSRRLRVKSEEEIAKRRSAYTLHEPFQEFIAPGVFRKSSGSIALTYSTESLLGSELDDLVARAFGLTDVENAALVRDVKEAIAYQNDSGVDQADTETQDDEDTDADLLIDNSPKAAYCAAISYLMGVAFGRWDVRVVLGTKALPQLGTSSDPIPRLPPGALTTDGGEIASAASHVPADYPVRVAWSGVLAEDEGHDEDIVRSVLEVLQRIRASGWTAEEAEQDEASYSAEELRSFLRHSFFREHLRTYTKSRRKAPVYWQLATPSASYSVWLYIHGFTKDTLFRVQNDYVVPKLAHEERRLEALANELREHSTAAQRKELAAQETFVEELRAFVEEIKRVAPLWNPDLDDGVIINFAPLWRLVPQHKAWQKELKSTWGALCKGEFDWAHLAMHLWPERVVPQCVTDRSLAIAHGLEDVLWVEGSDGKWTARKTPTQSIDELVRERTAPAVKAALKSLLDAPLPAGTARKRKKGDV